MLDLKWNAYTVNAYSKKINTELEEQIQMKRAQTLSSENAHKHKEMCDWLTGQSSQR